MLEISTDRQIDKSCAITRTSSPTLDEMLGWSLPVLDHGFIRVIDYMGDDDAIDEAARLSYGSGTKRTNEAKGLINYLMGHRHTSPFEMCELKLHIRLPIFVMRQWIRHRMANVNEYSARYSILSNEFYLPQLEDLQPQSQSNKQGRDGAMDDAKAVMVRDRIQAHSLQSYAFYEMLISEDIDLARELARMSLPVNFYTEMYWKIDLHNLFHFLMLRADSHAQKEIRLYAEMIEWIVSKWVPYAFDAYRVYRKGAISFSAHEALLIRTALAMSNLSDEEKPVWADKLSMREWKAFLHKINQIT